MTAPSRRPPQRPPATGGSPAVVITLVAGLLGLLLSLNSGGFALALFLGAVSLAALPMALSDKPGPRGVQLALLGGATGALALVLVLGTLLFGGPQEDARNSSPARARTDVPSTPRPVTTTPAQPTPTG